MNRPLRLAEWFVGVSWVLAALLADRQQLQGPIYRARIYEYTHEMEDGNVRAMMWKCVCDYVYTHI